MRRKLTTLIIAPGLLGFIQPAAAEPPVAAGPIATGPVPAQAAGPTATGPVPAQAVVPDGPEAGTGPLRAGTAAAPAGDTLDALLREAEDRVRALSQAKAADPAAVVRAELALARERIAALEAARAEDRSTIARLRAEVDQLRNRTLRLSQELDASWQWVEELNAILASLGARPLVPDAGAAGGARAQVPTPTALASPAPRTAAASPIPLAAMFAAEPRTADRDDDTAAAAAADAHYTVVQAVNLRAAPRITADVVTVLGRGAVVRRVAPMEGERGWLRVTYNDGAARDVTGWIYEDFLRPVGGPARAGEARSGAGG